MTNAEIIQLLMLLEAEYPHSFERLDDKQKELKRELWLKEFAEDDQKVVYTATRLLMRDGIAFAPSSGQIRKKIQELLEPEQLTEQQAWALVSKACENGYYGYKEEFAKLPPDVQKAVGRPEQLKEWAIMDISTLQSVVASNFMRSYKITAKREKEMARIPESIRSVLSGVSERMRLMEGSHEVEDQIVS